MVLSCECVRALTSPSTPHWHRPLSGDKQGELSNASDLEGDRDKVLYLLWDALIARARGVGTKTTGEGASAPSGEGSLKHLNGLEAGSSFDICWDNLKGNMTVLRAHNDGSAAAAAAAVGGAEGDAEEGEGVSGPENEEGADGKGNDDEGGDMKGKQKQKKRRRKEGEDDGSASVNSSDVSSDEEEDEVGR